MNITGGNFKGRILNAPSETITRPTLSKVRMGIFNTLYSLIGDFESKSFLDMFGGSGIMGLEALSRGFANVLVFEKNIKAAQVIKKNYELLGLTPNLKIGDSLKLACNIESVFDVIFIDPPYSCGIYNEIFDKIKDKAKIIIVEHAETIDESNLTLIKTKNYGGKKVSFYKS